MSISVTQLLPASSCPSVQVNTLEPTLAAAHNNVGSGIPGGPTIEDGETTELCSILNEAFAYAYMIANRGGAMPGVLWGMQPAFIAGLQMQILAGQANVGGIVEFANPVTIAANDNSTQFLWVSNSGTLQWTATNVSPVGNWLYLLNVTASGGVITAFDSSGAQFTNGGLATRITADYSAPGDAPSAVARIMTQTPFGNFLWDGVSHKQLIDTTKQAPASVGSLVASGTVQLAANTPNSLWITVSAGTPTIQLPNPALIPPGWNCTLVNLDPSASFVLKDYTGATTYCTVTSGHQINVGILPNATPQFPSGTYTPVAVSHIVGPA